jgi:hypothetical protein
MCKQASPQQLFETKKSDIASERASPNHRQKTPLRKISISNKNPEKIFSGSLLKETRIWLLPKSTRRLVVLHGIDDLLAVFWLPSLPPDCLLFIYPLQFQPCLVTMLFLRQIRIQVRDAGKPHSPDSSSTPRDSSADDEAEDEYLLSCQCESTRVISTLLKCLIMDKGRHGGGNNTSTSTSTASTSISKKLLPVTVVCHPTSLTFHVQGAAKTSHASVDLQAGLFMEYRVKQVPQGQPAPSFSVNLLSILECLHVLGTHHLERCKVGLAYNDTQEILHIELLMDDASVLSKAAVPGLYLGDNNNSNDDMTSLAAAFTASPLQARLLVQSEYLKDALQELEPYNIKDPSTRCTVAISKQNGLELGVVGHACEVVLSLLPPASNVPQYNDSDNNNAVGTASCLLSLDCHTTSCAATFPLHLFWLGMRGLDIAQETCISINRNNMIAIQHQVVDTTTEGVGDGSANFVDFLLLPLRDDDDDEEEERENVRPVGMRQGGLMTGNNKSQQESPTQHYGDPYKSSSDSEVEQERPISSAAPLFGTVVPADSTTAAANHQERGRAVRRRRRAPAAPAASMEEEMERRNSSSSSEDENGSLDVASAHHHRRRGRRSRRRDNDPPSSPELVYGED